MLSVKVLSDVRLQVPGVAENRPSVLRGDCIKVSMSDDKHEPITVYTGYVHRVELDRVKLGFANRYGEGWVGGLSEREHKHCRFALVSGCCRGFSAI